MYGQAQPKEAREIQGMDDVVQELRQRQSDMAFKRAAGTLRVGMLSPAEALSDLAAVGTRKHAA